MDGPQQENNTMKRLTTEEVSRLDELGNTQLVDFTPEMRVEVDGLKTRRAYFCELDELERKMKKATKKYFEFLNSVPRNMSEIINDIEEGEVDIIDMMDGEIVRGVRTLDTGEYMLTDEWGGDIRSVSKEELVEAYDKYM